MRNIALPFFLLLMIFSGASCLKGSDPCTPKAPTSEAAQMQAYCAANGITPTIHSSGLFYQIVSPGSGPAANTNSKIVITYIGKLANGTVFDQRTTPNNTQTTGPESPWPLSQLIEGWRVGIPLIQKGGQIKLVVPSSMAYGCAGYGTIPGDAILYFEINLVDVQ